MRKKKSQETKKDKPNIKASADCYSHPETPSVAGALVYFSDRIINRHIKDVL